MGFLLNHTTFQVLSRDVIDSCEPFTCGKADLDDFFLRDAVLYSESLLGKSYCYLSRKAQTEIVCAFTVSNDSLRVDMLPNSRKKKVNSTIPYSKQMRRYPAVLIGRLGVNIKYARRNIGTELLSLIKQWFIERENKTGCRYLVVDAYNEKSVLDFYCTKNGFRPLFSTEEQEAEALHQQLPLSTRYLFFDLINISQS